MIEFQFTLISLLVQQPLTLLISDYLSFIRINIYKSEVIDVQLPYSRRIVVFCCCTVLSHGVIINTVYYYTSYHNVYDHSFLYV